MSRRHEARVDWKHLVFYGAVAVLVIAIGVLAIWSFIERQHLVYQPEPLPRVTVVVPDATSRLGAAWVTLLTNAEMQATLVPLETFDPIDGVVMLCDVAEIDGRLATLLDRFVQAGGALAFAGTPPATPIGRVRLAWERGESGGVLKLAEATSPVLARLNPGYEMRVQNAPVAFLKESPRMVVDARWSANARAAVMHMEQDGARYLWLGLDPEKINAADVQLRVLLRTAFRWVAGQPVSDGAVGSLQVASTLTPAARREARANRFSFTVDRSSSPDLFTVRMRNLGAVSVTNPTVKVWLPPRVTRVALGGDFIMKRNATLIGIPEEGACLITLPRLAPQEDRMLKLKIVERRKIARTEQAGASGRMGQMAGQVVP